MLRRMWQCVLLPTLVASAAMADTGTWTAVGPEGGYLEASALDPDNPDTAYVIAQGGVLYRRLQPGAAWQYAGRTDAEALAVAGGGRLYVGGFGNVYRSDDSGTTYTRTYIGSAFIRALAVDPNDPDVVYAVGEPFQSSVTRVYRSGDGARTWNEMSATLPVDTGGYSIRGFFVDGAAPTTLRIAFTVWGVWQSDDSGATWAPINEGLPCAESERCLESFDAAGAGASDALFAGTHHYGLFRSTDGGAHWTPANDGLAAPTVAIARDGAQPHVLYAATNRPTNVLPADVFRSDDDGASWTATGGRPGAAVTAITVSGARLSAATVDGFYESEDAGETWSARQAGLDATCSFHLAAAATPRTTLYAGVNWKLFIGPETDGSWRTPSIPGRNAAPVALDPNNPLRSFVSTIAGPALSADGGETYTPVSADSFLYRKLIVDPRDGDTLYAAVYPNGVLTSRDAGRTWTEIRIAESLGEVRDLAIEPIGGVLYALYENALLESRDGGTTWAELLHSASARDTFYVLQVAPTSPPTLFVDGLDSVQVSHDGGRRWQPLPLPGDPQLISTVAIDPSRARTVYVTESLVGAKQVHRSDDAGTTWRAVGDPIDGVISELAVDPNDRALVYATICGRGVQQLVQDSTGDGGDSDGCAVVPSAPSATMLATHGLVLGLLALLRRRRVGRRVDA